MRGRIQEETRDVLSHSLLRGGKARIMGGLVRSKVIAQKGRHKV